MIKLHKKYQLCYLNQRLQTTYSYICRVSTSISIFLNCILGGHSNQTFSARNWELKLNNLPNAVWLIDAIFFMHINHCEQSYVKWKMIKQAIERYNKQYRSR